MVTKGSLALVYFNRFTERLSAYYKHSIPNMTLHTDRRYYIFLLTFIFCSIITIYFISLQYLTFEFPQFIVIANDSMYISMQSCITLLFSKMKYCIADFRIDIPTHLE